jgi:shikimate kinase
MARVILVGLPGVGKTSAGRALAKRWKTTFIDTDALFKRELGISVSDHIREFGEPAFRQQELLILEQAVNAYDVVSTGGGIVSTPQARNLLKSSITFWLDCDDASILERLGGGDRPLLGEDRAKGLAALREKRQALYEEVATARVEASGKLVQTVNGLVAAYEKVAK